ncbi:Capping protein, Arp2/3 and myosin-I linker protein 3 [Bagarius yarrelli]|uniref:Capping protein, Arp2/3 and myosin-I linker protein 3 n=1 Tax=Bagarius yarrelli TaxID=175774 RepID=A0A556UF69_BAGYA|nr:Capping protein, Arp2/3 and myosin-I linker protein 3 [Bagarius yarrelli]
MAAKDSVPAAGFLSVSWEMTESIKRAIDKPSIKFAQAIKVESKNGKSEDRVLVLATWRLYLMAPKLPTKVEQTFNYLEIRAIRPQPENQVFIEMDKSTYVFKLQSSDHMDQLLCHINFSLSRIFNNSICVPSIFQADGEISDGGHKYSPSSETSVEAQRACGGFSETYAALCDYNGITCKEEVQWDVDTIYHSQDNREFNLLDFAHLESRDFPQKMAAALAENPASVLHSLNLAHNTFDNQGVSNLIQQVCQLSKGLRLLNLSKTSFSSKGVSSLSQALCSSDDYSSSLLHLDLSKNPGILSGEDATNLYLFLAQPNCLVHLDLSGTDCALESLFGALLRGCCADLSFLNLSRNSFSHRKVKETSPTLRQFFTSAFSLSHLIMASMKMPPDVLRSLFLGLSSNPHISDLHLDISGCELKSAGATVIKDLFPQVSSISTLDVSDNGLDADLYSVIPAFSRHPSLKHLLLGKNFNVKGRLLDEIVQRLVQLVQEEECGLQSLSLAESRLRSRGTVLVNALGSNACLRKVDLSGNGLEDTGARMLSKALQINTTLRSVTWDRNNTTAAGFQDIARSLEHNFTLQCMPVPLSDVTQAYRSSPEKTEKAVVKIQKALLRNNQSQRFSQKQVLRLHQGLVTSTAEQVMERLCVRVQQQVCVLRAAGEGEELQTARQVLKEARNSRALYPSLCELAHMLSVDGPVRQKLESLTGELAKAADKELQVIVDSMVSLCRELCPLSSAAAEHLSPPLSSISERVSIPRSDIRTALMERAAQDIDQALEEVKISVVSYLTNSVVDQILQELYATHKTLLQQVARVRRADDSAAIRPTLRHADTVDIPEDDFSISIDTIAIKKRSSRTRRIRPVSTRLSLGDDPNMSPSLLAPCPSVPLPNLISWDNLSSLPTQGAPLRHVTRIRPRPPRKHRPGLTPPDVHFSENGEVNLLDDGLPDFYTKRVLPDSQLSSHHVQSVRRKKRRSVLSIFTGFRKNRYSASYQEPEHAMQGEVCGNECRTQAGPELLYSVIQHPKDYYRAETSKEEANGAPGDERPLQVSGRAFYGILLPGMRAVSPSCIAGRQSPEDSEVSLASDITTPTNRDNGTPKDVQDELCVQDSNQSTPQFKEKAMPKSQQRPKPPSQSSKPRLGNMRHHLEENSAENSEEDAEEEKNKERGDKEEDIRSEEVQEKKAEKQMSLISQKLDKSPEKLNDLKQIPSPLPAAHTKPASRLVNSFSTQGTKQVSSIGVDTKPHRNQKAHSCESGFNSELEEDISGDVERSSDPKPPVKKPRLPPRKNKSLDTPVLSCVWQAYGLTLSVAPPIRRGSTPLPIKHLLKREEAVSEDYDWIPGLDEPSSLSISNSDAQDTPLLLKAPEQKYHGPLRIVLLGQNGVGKSSLALSLAGLSDRSLSIDSETLASGEGYQRRVTVDDEDSSILVYDNWKQLRLLLRESHPNNPIILVGNKSDLVRSREISTEDTEGLERFIQLTIRIATGVKGFVKSCQGPDLQPIHSPATEVKSMEFEAHSHAVMFDCMYLELSVSLDHGTNELLEMAVRAARGHSLGPGWTEGSPGGGRRQSLTSRAKRFLSGLVPRSHHGRERLREQERHRGNRMLRQKSRSCHDLSALM